MKSTASQYPRTAPTEVGKRGDLAPLHSYIPSTHPHLHPHDIPRGRQVDFDRKIRTYDVFRPAPPLEPSKKEWFTPLCFVKKRKVTPPVASGLRAGRCSRDGGPKTRVSGTALRDDENNRRTERQDEKMMKSNVSRCSRHAHAEVGECATVSQLFHFFATIGREHKITPRMNQARCVLIPPLRRFGAVPHQKPQRFRRFHAVSHARFCTPGQHGEYLTNPILRRREDAYPDMTRGSVDVWRQRQFQSNPAFPHIFRRIARGHTYNPYSHAHSVHKAQVRDNQKIDSRCPDAVTSPAQHPVIVRCG